MLRQIHARPGDRRAFAFQQTALQGGKRLADENPSTSADHAVPWDASPVGAGGHGIARQASSSAKPQRFGELSIGHNPAAGNLLYEPVDGLPGRHRSALLLARLMKTSHLTLPFTAPPATAISGI